MKEGRKIIKKRSVIELNPVANMIVFIIVLSIGLSCLVPYLLAVSVSFTDPGILQKEGARLLPKVFSLETYKYVVFFKEQLVQSFKVTIFVTVVGTILSTWFTITLSYVLSRHDFRYSKFFTMVIFLTMLFNAGMVPNYMVIAQVLNLRNTVWALIVPLLINPFWILVSKTFFKITIPFEMIEAAKVDGASEVKIFSRIVLPLSLPIIATNALFSSIAYWNDWFSSMLYISDSKLVSLQYMMQKIQTRLDFLVTQSDSLPPEIVIAITKVPMISLMMGIMIIATLPIVISYPFFQRYFISGLTIGAVK